MPKEAGFGREGKAKANDARFPGLPIGGVSALWSRRPKWWNGIHIRLKICRRKAYRFESGLGYDNPSSIKSLYCSYLHKFTKGFYTYVKDVEI